MDNNFDYSEMEREERPFAFRLMQWINRNCKPDMVDLGAGPGFLAEIARDFGWNRARGYDITENQPRPNIIQKASMLDITDPANTIICMEVAEHIPAELSEQVMDSIYRNTLRGGTVVFSAAQPGQGGVGHINCQPPQFWRERAIQRGLIQDEYLEKDLLRFIVDGYHMGWFRNNLQIWYKP